jgi:hypothetical protein
LKTLICILLPLSFFAQRVERAGGYYIEATPTSITYRNMEYSSIIRTESVKVDSDSLKTILLQSLETQKSIEARFGNVTIKTQPYKKKVSILIYELYLSSTMAITKEDIETLFNYGTPD